MAIIVLFADFVMRIYDEELNAKYGKLEIIAVKYTSNEKRG